jgi:hypothetical protein
LLDRIHAKCLARGIDNKKDKFEKARIEVASGGKNANIGRKMLRTHAR